MRNKSLSQSSVKLSFENMMHKILSKIWRIKIPSMNKKILFMDKVFICQILFMDKITLSMDKITLSMDKKYR